VVVFKPKQITQSNSTHLNLANINKIDFGRLL
jgi:hypothetical protein